MDQKSKTTLPIQIGISLLTPPILVGLTIAREISDMMTNMGVASEEIFRGQHLPILKTNNSNDQPKM